MSKGVPMAGVDLMILGLILAIQTSIYRENLLAHKHRKGIDRAFGSDEFRFYQRRRL